MDPTQFTILVVDDEEDVADLVIYNLEKEGFKTIKALDGTTGLEIAQRVRPSVMILDLMLPGLNGFQVFHALKQDSRTKDIPVIMLTAKAETSDRILGLKAGVDDYVTKPFSPKELILRVAAVLKWVRPEPSETMVETGPFVLDRGQLRCYVGGELIRLTSTEFKILLALVDGSGVTVTRDDLVEKIWGSIENATSRTVDTHVMRLRRKLGKDGDRIKNVRGQGYRYEPDSEDA